jgi:hypothetical protein
MYINIEPLTHIETEAWGIERGSQSRSWSESEHERERARERERRSRTQR